MQAGICTKPLLPIRSEPSECSEMVTQILFGELFEIFEEKDSWSRIRNLSDNHIGWGTTKMMQKLSPEIFLKLESLKPVLTRDVIAPCYRKDDATPRLFLPAGSRLYDFDKSTGSFPVFFSKAATGNIFEMEDWHIEQSNVDNDRASVSMPKDIVAYTSRFLNAPYLWGGKSILGMDCSGLVQMVFSIFGFDLPRESRDQVLIGDPVVDLSVAQPADLAFFANPEGKVVHVGLLLDANHIIHASGSVHVDPIDNYGIFSETLGRYTHSLFAIRRLPLFVFNK